MAVTYFLLLSCLGLAITAQAQDCSRPVPGPNMDLSDKDILLQTFPDGTKVSFACSVGYTSAGGPSVITCTAGRWSPVRLTCEKKNCGSLGEMDNGIIDYPEGTEFGAKAVITCKSGWRFVGKQGPRKIVCGDQGWDGRLPECEVVVCDPPPAVVNGTFSPEKDVYGYGEVIQYRCQNDFTLNGSRSSSCSDNGTFMPESPKCIMVQCQDPDIKNADWVQGSRPPHGYKATVTYQCRTGYKMIGERTQTCEINNQWSPGLPRCEMIECGNPHVENADRVQDPQPPYRYKATVTYQCRTGYKMIGERTQTCEIDGQWSPGLPKCEMIECGNPLVENADRVQDSQPPYRYNATVTYQCRTGYKMIGGRTQTCEIDGQWSPGLPKCEMIECGNPLVENADRVQDSQPPYRYNATVTYQCRTGYKMIGGRTQTCEIDGQWSPGLPKCEKMTGPTKPAAATTTATTTTTMTPTGGNTSNYVKPVVIVVVLIAIIIAIILGCYYSGVWARIREKLGSGKKAKPQNGATNPEEEVALS